MDIHPAMRCFAAGVFVGQGAGVLLYAGNWLGGVMFVAGVAWMIYESRDIDLLSRGGRHD